MTKKCHKNDTELKGYNLTLSNAFQVLRGAFSSHTFWITKNHPNLSIIFWNFIMNHLKSFFQISIKLVYGSQLQFSLRGKKTPSPSTEIGLTTKAIIFSSRELFRWKNQNQWTKCRMMNLRNQVANFFSAEHLQKRPVCNMYVCTMYVKMHH